MGKLREIRFSFITRLVCAKNMVRDFTKNNRPRFAQSLYDAGIIGDNGIEKTKGARGGVHAWLPMSHCRGWACKSVLPSDAKVAMLSLRSTGIP